MNYNSLLQRDFKSSEPTRRRLRLRRVHLIGVLALSAIVGLLLVVAWHDAGATRHPGLTDTSHGSPSTATRITMALPLPPNSGDKAPVQEILDSQLSTAWQAVTVRSGDSLAAIFSRLGLSPRELHDLMASSKETARLRQIMPGQGLRFLIDSDSSLRQLVYAVSPLESLFVVRTGDTFHASLEQRETEIRAAYAHGVIDSSLFLAGQRSGLSDNLIMELAAIFGWDVDFALDIREGDEFSVIFEEHFLDGEKLHDGAILGAEFVNQGRRYQAVRYVDPDGRADYFAPDGMSMRKAFLRTPVEFSRISSRFGKRKHPVLNKFRAHKGVDYAAPRGTPIKAAGDGKVIFAGTKGGYGRTAIIQHGGRYSTLYAHMSKFAGGVRSGRHVRQGQTIGYVGSSGLATGPHLHYEFRVNGVHRNPLTVKLPEAAPISAALKSDFLDHADRLARQLAAHRESRIALNAN